MLIWLRGISYGSKYEVEIKCPNCERRFSHTIDLDQLLVNYCPPDLQPPLEDTLPKCGLKFSWILPKGKDENLVTEYREKRLKEFGDAAIDDSLLYRIALLVDNIEELRDKTELLVLLKKLPIQDVSYLRSMVTDPPFGVDTKINVTCPYGFDDFEVELPFDASFFFPKHRKEVEEKNSNSGDT